MFRVADVRVLPFAADLSALKIGDDQPHLVADGGAGLGTLETKTGYYEARLLSTE